MQVDWRVLVMKVGYFPFKPGGNPYQSLFAEAIEQAGYELQCIPPYKLFPVQKAVFSKVDLLQLDWPHDWYRGKNVFTSLIKHVMYLDGIRRLRSVPVVWTAHNLIAHDAENVDFERRMIQKLINVADGIIVMSNLAESQLKETYEVSSNTHVKVIPHGHYIDVYRNNIERHAARERLGVAKDEKVVLSFGRILPYKGLECLIETFGQLAQKNTRLLIAGSCNSPEYLLKLKSMAAELSTEHCRIQIEARFVVDDEVQVFFNAADFVVLPFQNILNSGSLLLAMSFGKHVVAPSIGSIGEVAYSKAWTSYSPNDENGLVSALGRALEKNYTSSDEREVIEYVSSKFGWREVSLNLKDLYANVFNGHQKL